MTLLSDSVEVWYNKLEIQVGRLGNFKLIHWLIHFHYFK